VDYIKETKLIIKSKSARFELRGKREIITVENIINI